MADVFLSYAREDWDRASVLLDALRDQGWEVWSDQSLVAGSRWDEEIERQLDAARCVVVTWSAESVRKETVLDEANEGRERNILVPVLIERVKLPLGFRRRQTADLVDWKGDTAHPQFRSLVESIQRIAPVHGRPLPPPPADGTPSMPLAPPLGPDVQADHLTRLTEILDREWPTPKARVDAVEQFCSEHGDPRFRADAWFLPADPNLGFIEIPAGPFRMGSDRETDDAAFDDEQPVHEVALPTFYIARFPVTVAQFKAHLDDAGAKPGDPGCLRGVANHPVVNVSWHEALAYCAWLTERLTNWPETPDALASVLRPMRKGDKAWRVTLASEAEWEKAARGADGRIYPWGDMVDPNNANYRDTGLGDTSAVGCFPSGMSSYRVEDLSGNVWTWTRSLWGKDRRKPTFKYPYGPKDGRENLWVRDDVLRVVRGGAFYSGDRDVRSACRYWSGPGKRGWLIGFRVVVSPFFSDL